MKKCNATLNPSVPGRAKKEYCLYYRFGDNRKDYLKKRKEYREKHKDEIMEYRLNKKDKIRETNSKYKQQNKDKVIEYQKQYRNANKEKNKPYREQNKDKINEHKSEKIQCECGCEIRRNGMSAHRKSKKTTKTL